MDPTCPHSLLDPLTKGGSALRDLCRSQIPLLTSPVLQELRELDVKEAHSPTLLCSQPTGDILHLGGRRIEYKLTEVLHLP